MTRLSNILKFKIRNDNSKIVEFGIGVDSSDMKFAKKSRNLKNQKLSKF